MSLISIPIFNNFDDDRQPVAVMASWIDWAMYFELVLPESVQGIHVVLLDSCGEFFTFAILGERVAFLGSGDLHNHDFNNHRISAKFEDGQYIVDGTKLGLSLNQGVCNIRIDVYLLQAFYNSNKTNMPLVPTVLVAIIFVFTAFMFVMYDHIVKLLSCRKHWNPWQLSVLFSPKMSENV